MVYCLIEQLNGKNVKMHARVRNILFLLFALSGFSGLIYESIWTHYLKLFLGHAAYAQTLVLAIFMGGMAIGSWLCSNYSTHWKNLLTAYALAEGMIGLLALIFHNLFDQTLQFSYVSIIPYLPTPMAVNTFKWVLSALLILPQSIMLGTTFPLMSAGILRIFPKNPGKSVSMLYFTNSIGAAIGVLFSGFILIRMMGLPGTIRLAGLMNIALAIVVWLLARSHKVESGFTFERKSDNVREQFGSVSLYRLFLIVSLITGTASFIYEIGWIRMLSLVLGSSTHAFELMLSAFIFGLAFGGLWIQHRIEHIVSPVRSLVMVQIIMGLLALSTLPLYGNTFGVMQWILKTLSKTDSGYAIFNLYSHAITLAVMLPTTFFAGITLPLITYILIRRGHGERSIGAVYASNTVGAIIGVFFAIHLGMPLLGLKGLITFGAGLDIALGLALLWSVSGYASNRLPVLVTITCFCAIVLTLLFVKLDLYKMASGVYRDGDLLTSEDSRLIYHKDGKTATVSLSLLNDVLMSIRTNGKEDASINMNPYLEASPDEVTMILSAVIPMALHPHAKMAANIGFGSGLTTHTLLSNPLLEQVDTVEIESNMVEAARNFGTCVELSYKDPRSKIFIDDAKTFFSAHNKKYDIIISEPSNPWVSGVASLFSEEFYHLINRYLNENGLFVQWVQLYEIDLDLVASIFKAISSNFSDFIAYASNNGDLLIIATKRDTIGSLDSNIFRNLKIAEALQRIHIKSIQDIEIRKIGNKKILSKLFETFPTGANSDYYPVLDQNAARTRFLKVNANDLIGLSNERLPTLEMLMGSDPSWKDTNITQTPFFPKSQSAYKAMALRDFFLYGSFKPRYWDIPKDIKKQAMKVNHLFHRCGFLSEEDRLISLFNTATNMVPYLRPNELDAVWRSLESGQCMPSLTMTEKYWLSLFKALGRRDAKTMASTAKILLESGDNMTVERLRYLVGVAMLGNLAEGNKEESSKVWSNYQSRMYENSQPSLLFRLLVANSAIR